MRMRDVFVVCAQAVSAAGVGRNAIGDAVAAKTNLFRPSRELEATHPNVQAGEVPEIPDEAELFSPRTRGRMSRAAQLAVLATRHTLLEAAWTERRDEIGYFLGVGGSGGSVGEIEAMLAVSMEQRNLSLRLLGAQGLLACNPLFTFQTLHNFTLCHSAILEGVGGPNSAFFSRGAGTLTALEEAVASIREGDCTQALAGGADTALHPVTWAELVRDGHVGSGLVPGEGAGILALSSSARRPLATVESCRLYPVHSQLVDEALTGALGHFRQFSPEKSAHVVIAPWGEPPRLRLRSCVEAQLPSATIVDANLMFGETLAASPALAWVTAIDLLTQGHATGVLVLSVGIDEHLGCVVFRRGGST
jgi:Beta-ketoacyl synthase, N-terminal domain